MVLSNHLTEKVLSLSDSILLSPVDERFRAGIVTFKLESKNKPNESLKKLSDMGITISVREGYYRISPHFYNTLEETDKALEYL